MCSREKSSRRGDVVCMSVWCVRVYVLCVCGEGVAVVNRAVWEDITEKVISEQRAEGGEEMYHVRIWRRKIQAENSMSKGPEEGVGGGVARSVVGASGGRAESTGAEVRK